MIVALVVRRIGEQRLTNVMELPHAAHAGDRITCPGTGPLAVLRVVLHCREGSDWRPGVVAARVEIETAPEHADALPAAIERGWQMLEAPTAVT